MECDESIQLAITMGDPGGIGPEVILKALAAGLPCGVGVTIYGAEEVLCREERLLRAKIEGFDPVLSMSDVEIVEVVPELSWEERPVGWTGAKGATTQYRALQAAMEAVDAGEADAIVTAPWNKELFAASGRPVVGHTEVLTEHFGAREVVMMLAGPRLRVSLVTTHIALREVADAIDEAAIEKTLRVTAHSLADRFGVDAPRIAVCGLNPHAGEGGHMGTEELEIIEPVLENLQEKMRAQGVEVAGPFPADTLFAKFRREQPYDAVVCMYHDQGLIPLKLMHFGQSANVTLGLPGVRTSVDHGTAYDIAGQAVADEGSMRYALEMAVEMVRRSVPGE